MRRRATASARGEEPIRHRPTIRPQGCPEGGGRERGQQAHEIRLKRRQRAQEKAQKATIELVFPTLLCIFPALFVVVIGPGIIQMAQTLFGSGGPLPHDPEPHRPGRLGMLVLGVLGASTALAAVLRHTSPARVAAAALTLAFYALLVWAYLRRRGARSTSRAWSVWVAAPVATLLPLALPLLGNGTAGAVPLAIGEALLVLGMAWSVWSIRTLDRSLSVVPQARELVRTGPYARVRHPLYLGEIVATLGVALTVGSTLPLAGWAALDGPARARRSLTSRGAMLLKVHEVIKLLAADGWVIKRTSGSHRHFVHPAKPALSRSQVSRAQP